MSGYHYLFCCSEFCIGALVGASAVKGASSLRTGLAVTLLLATGAIVELILIDELRHNRRPGNIVAYVIAGLGFYLIPAWVYCLLSACIGYCLGFWVLGRHGVGGWQFGIPTLLAFVAIYAVVAAIARMM